MSEPVDLYMERDGSLFYSLSGVNPQSGSSLVRLRALPAADFDALVKRTEQLEERIESMAETYRLRADSLKLARENEARHRKRAEQAEADLARERGERDKDVADLLNLRAAWDCTCHYSRGDDDDCAACRIDARLEAHRRDRRGEQA